MQGLSSSIFLWIFKKSSNSCTMIYKIREDSPLKSQQDIWTCEIPTYIFTKITWIGNYKGQDALFSIPSFRNLWFELMTFIREDGTPWRGWEEPLRVIFLCTTSTCWRSHFEKNLGSPAIGTKIYSCSWFGSASIRPQG